MSKDFILNVQNNNILRITAFGIEHIATAPCLIFVHGFKGFKDWGFGPYVGDYFSKKRFFVLTFNFSHNGVGDSLTDFVELNKFAENTFSIELDELKELILAYDFGYFGNSSNKGIGLIGHSRGGAISLLVGSESDDVKAVCAWSTVSNFDRYTNRQKDEWKKPKPEPIKVSKKILKMNSCSISPLNFLIALKGYKKIRLFLIGLVRL